MPNSHDNQQDDLKPKVLWGWFLEPSCFRKPSCLLNVYKDHSKYHEEDTRRGYVLKVGHKSRLALLLISNNHMSLQCRCGHSKLVSVKELIDWLSPTTTIYEVAKKAKCSHFGAKSAVDFRLHYVCRTKEDL